MKSTLRTTAEILILIGAILSTITSSLVLLATFWLVLPIIWFGAVIAFTWVTRYQAITNNSRGWIIFGIVLSSFTNWVGLAGYICMLIENIQDEQKSISTNSTTPSNNSEQLAVNPFTEQAKQQVETQEIKFEQTEK